MICPDQFSDHSATEATPDSPATWEPGIMATHLSGMDYRQLACDHMPAELALQIEDYIERIACGRIRDLHVVCSEETIILQGRTRTYHAKQLAQQAALDLTDSHTVLTNQIIVC
jgi:hypothetical protein